MTYQPSNHESHTVNVFVDEHDEYGNAVGIVIDLDHKLSMGERQEIAIDLGYSESVFVDMLNPLRVTIHNPQEQVAFAGHAILGAAWYARNISHIHTDTVLSMGKVSKVVEEDNLLWVRTNKTHLPHWNVEQLASPAKVEAITVEQAATKQHTVSWAWIKEGASIRARTFAPDWGIPEDEANGSGSMLLALELQPENTPEPIEIHHGKGSVIYSRHLEGLYVMVGGRARLAK